MGHIHYSSEQIINLCKQLFTQLLQLKIYQIEKAKLICLSFSWVDHGLIL